MVLVKPIGGMGSPNERRALADNGRNGCALWIDRWIPFLPVGHPMSMGDVAVLRNTRVESLICANSKSWNINFLMPFVYL